MAAPAIGETHRLWNGRARCGATANRGLLPLVTDDPELVTCERCLGMAPAGDAREQQRLV